jgi:hypothetical protein
VVTNVSEGDDEGSDSLRNVYSHTADILAVCPVPSLGNELQGLLSRTMNISVRDATCLRVQYSLAGMGAMCSLRNCDAPEGERVPHFMCGRKRKMSLYTWGRGELQGLIWTCKKVECWENSKQ